MTPPPMQPPLPPPLNAAAAPRFRATDVAIGLAAGTAGLLILTMEILVSLLGGPPSVRHAETEGGSYRAQSPDLYCHSYGSGGGDLLAQALGAHQEQVLRPPLQSSNINP